MCTHDEAEHVAMAACQRPLRGARVGGSGQGRKAEACEEMRQRGRVGGAGLEEPGLGLGLRRGREVWHL